MDDHAESHARDAKLGDPAGRCYAVQMEKLTCNRRRQSVLATSRAFLFLTIVCSLSLTAFTPQAAHADEIVYLSQPWFHKADNLNLLTTQDGHRLVVDNASKHIVDVSTLPSDRNIKFDLDSIYEHDGVYYLGRYLGNHGYDYFALGTRDDMLTRDDIATKKPWENSLFRATGHHMDPDRTRGDIGLAIFPEAGVAVTCGQTQWDSRAFRVSLFRQGEKTPSYDVSKELPIYTGAGSSVRSEDHPDRVFVDEAADGFWFLGSQDVDGSRKLMLAFITPMKNDNGDGTLKLDKPIAVGDFANEKFENGIVIGDNLYLLIATKDATVAGVQPQRRLLRINHKTGNVIETKITFDEYLDDIKLAAVGEDVLVYGPRAVRLVNGQTLDTTWTRTITSGPENKYTAYRAVANPQGTKIAIGTATPYRKPGENTRLVILNRQGETIEQFDLKPGSIDHMTFTDDGGLLVCSAQYTAKIGGSTNVKANEAAAIAKAQTAMQAIAGNASAAQKPVDVESFTFLETPIKERFKVWFDKPAKGFGSQSLPIGNGAMGVMLSGGTDKANIVFNVDSHWTGGSPSMGSYQGFGQINLHLGHDPKMITNYRRELDLRTGIHVVSYTYDGVRYTREAFCSYPAGLFAIRFTADQPGKLSGDIELMSNHPATFTKSKNGIEFTGELKNNQRKFKAVLEFDIEGGTVSPEKGKSGERTARHRRLTATMPFDAVNVKDANSITLFLAADTDYSPDASQDFRGDDPAVKIAPRLANAKSQTFEEMMETSAADVAALFDRCTLDLATDNPEAEKLPIDQRKAAYRAGASDPGFEALVFAAQRHMIIASSRPGSLPANLQGVWNNSNWPAWTSDYHADINIQMAYWFTEPANLPEANDALFDYMESQIPVRRQIADKTYGRDVRGWNVHYMNNIFGGYAYKDFPGGSAWYAQHFAEHFKFNQDQAFLEKRAYPVLKELSEHWQDLLIERPDGTLVSPRTMSPEHKPPQFGISQDIQLVHNLFTDYAAASKRMETDEAFREEVLDMRSRLLPIKIGRWGQIQEWERDRDSRYSTHRHHHQMIAAFPGSQITTETPELADAVVTGLEARSKGRTGWSQVWRINIFARMGREDLAYRQVRVALPGFHDHLIWQSKNQIDAPAGYASGVCEMLLQSHQALDDTDSRFLIELLPALPDAWPTGKVEGMRARGGFEVDIEWANGKLVDATIYNINSPTNEATVRYGDETKTIKVQRGKSATFK